MPPNQRINESTNQLVDLHTHSTASDGTFTPTALAQHAREAGLVAFALTDHDTTAGLPEALAAGEQFGIEVIPGIEISAKRERGTLHIVGLFIDPADETLQHRCRLLREERDRRNRRMIERLNKLGMPITLEEAVAKSGGGVLGRPHIAAVLREKGYVTSIAEAFEKWLGKGCPAYFPKALFDPAEAIGMIHDAGGVAAIAHPSQLKCGSDDELDLTVGELKSLGMDAIETQWSNGKPDEMALAERMAERHSLLRSGGSDFHGSMKPTIRIGQGLGQLRMTTEMLEPLREAARARR